jgi:hypothetical protein
MLEVCRRAEGVNMGVALIMLGLGAFCVLLYHVAVYMLPFAVGLQVALWAIDTGAGVVGGIAVGFVTSGMVFAIGQVVFATSRSLTIRWIVNLFFAVPAAVAGYGMVMQVSELGLVPSPIWQHVFAVIGAAAIGGTAIARLAAPLPEPLHAPRQPTVRPSRSQPTGLQKSMLLPE